MFDIKPRKLGEAIQNHIRKRWQLPTQWPDTPDTLLAPDLRERIALLGIDDRQLIDVSPNDVVHKLEELERAAALEDAGDPETLARRVELDDVRFEVGKGR
ncbi:hypothetical protein VSX64_24075 [Aurantimonas sp. C2-6-R+9]|uniref:hypothetical protein n=1 Tax=unclassified Aurantimonas TaxID=2638230 RepID=UPI002E19BF0D|nr:hypothetical protein [Aurantimonas sp. C2-6-R+9]